MVSKRVKKTGYRWICDCRNGYGCFDADFERKVRYGRKLFKTKKEALEAHDKTCLKTHRPRNQYSIARDGYYYSVFTEKVNVKK